MHRLLHLLDKFPTMLPSGIVLIIILLLTLLPSPIDKDIPLFIGADKIVHTIMYGGFSVVISIDLWRRNWKAPKPIRYSLTAFFAASSIGVIIELAQSYMGLGRCFESADIAANIFGALIFTISIHIFLLKDRGRYTTIP